MLGTLRREAADAILAVHRPPPDCDLDTLERAADAAWAAYRHALGARAKGLDGLLERVDRLQWTDRQEIMDRDDLPEAARGELLDLMDRFDRILRAYELHYRYLTPVFEDARRRGHEPVRHLDVASGRGGFPMFVAERAKKAGLPIEVTGSDYQASHVAHATEAARRRGVPVAFRVVNGFDMAGIEPGSYDVVSCEQALHHMSAGQLARMIREGVRVATCGFVGVDGMREPGLVPVLIAATALATRDRRFVHDAWVSARRFFHREELRLIARLACPNALVTAELRLPGYNVLVVGRGGL